VKNIKDVLDEITNNYYYYPTEITNDNDNLLDLIIKTLQDTCCSGDTFTKVKSLIEQIKNLTYIKHKLTNDTYNNLRKSIGIFENTETRHITSEQRTAILLLLRSIYN
jgi:hypothetical protein